MRQRGEWLSNVHNIMDRIDWYESNLKLIWFNNYNDELLHTTVNTSYHYIHEGSQQVYIAIGPIAGSYSMFLYK